MTLSAFVELLVIGFQATLWAGLALWGVLGSAGLKSGLHRFAALGPLGFLGALAFVLCLGIVTDRLATWLVALCNPKKLFQGGKLGRKAKAETQEPRMRLWARTDPRQITVFIEGIRSRARLLRAALFNLLALMAVATVMALAGCDPLSNLPVGKVVAWIWIGGGALYLFLFVLLGSFEAGYDLRVSQALAALSPSMPEEAA